MAVYPALAIALIIAAYLKGRRDVWIHEFKIYNGALVMLTNFKRSDTGELKEYLKGRYYYCANKIPASWLGSPYDYGPVNTNVIHLSVGKGPTTANEEYRKFMQRHVQFRKPPGDPSAE